MIRYRPVLFLFRLIAGGVFIYAGILKVIDPLGFAQNILNYRVLPPSLCLPVALVLPWMELLTGFGLVAGIFKRTCAQIISLMLVGFIVLVAVTMVRGLNVDCGCFGTLSRKADWRLLVEDAVLLLMVLPHALPGKRDSERCAASGAGERPV